MKTGKKPILWSLIALVLPLLMVIPGLNIAALLLMLVPYTVLYTLLNRNSSIVHTLAVLVIGSLILDPILYLSFSCMAIIPSIVLANYYKKGLASSSIVPKMIGLVVVMFMLGLLMLENILNISIISDMSNYMTTMLNDVAAQGMSPIAWSSEMTDSFVTIMTSMIPLVFFIMALLVVACSHTIARRVVHAEGLQVTAYPKAKDWRLPRFLVFVYFIAYLLELTIDPTDGSFMTLAIMNLVPALSIIFAIQAVGFFYYIADNRGWAKVIPFLIAFPVLLLPPASIIGLLDVAFPLRKMFSKQQ
ncbi:DUF2232 domain-containing protein [Paenibacillus camelliae]|uniref:DUF2232 domain-containing protein n=1 Tax=Paenibacillus camelliae TaxID=512410 RepID=UPI0020406370|nr:DUF2232 domain-containing protein [Paenibacillus camelliae]MCM3635596.1 YybS family protein [Paenibacillus camelliae]